jgi:hypothetical protein
LENKVRKVSELAIFRNYCNLHVAAPGREDTFFKPYLSTPDFTDTVLEEHWTGLPDDRIHWHSV